MGNKPGRQGRRRDDGGSEKARKQQQQQQGEEKGYDGLELLYAMTAMQQIEEERKAAERGAALQQISGINLTDEQSVKLQHLSGLDLVEAIVLIAKEKEEEELEIAIALSKSLAETSPVRPQSVRQSSVRPPSARPSSTRLPSVRPWSARSQTSQAVVPSTSGRSSSHGQPIDNFKGVEFEQVNDELVADVLELYQEQRNISSEYIIVKRGSVIQSIRDRIREEDFDFEADPSISFEEEEGIDCGGPMREFFSSLIQEIQTSGIFEGPEKKVTFTYDLEKIQADEYYWAGVMVAWAVLHTGIGLQCLNPYVYARMLGTKYPDTYISDIPDFDEQEKVRRLASCKTSAELQQVCSDLFDWLCWCGVQPATLKIKDRDEVCNKIVQHYVYNRVMASADQFSKGLDRLGLLDILRDYPEPGQAFFVYPRTCLTATKLLELTNFSLSEIPFADMCTIQSLRDYLIEVEDGRHPVTLQEFLQFLTGSTEVPPGGFSRPIKIHFHDPEAEGRYPFCSTCSMEISLPRGLEQKEFADAVNEAIKCSPGFGTF